jgi:hypothetical protein
MVRGCRNRRAPDIEREHSSVRRKAAGRGAENLCITIGCVVSSEAVPHSLRLIQEVESASSDRMSRYEMGQAASKCRKFEGVFLKVLQLRAGGLVIDNGATCKIVVV